MIKKIAESLGYQIMRDGSWFHPETNKTVEITENHIIVTEETSYETKANVAHVLTCVAGQLDNAFLGKVDNDWAFVTDESMQESFVVLVNHLATGTTCIPIKARKVTFKQYHNGDFIAAMVREECESHALKFSDCEIFTMKTDMPCLTVIIAQSIEDGPAPRPSIISTELVKMDPQNDVNAKAIAALQQCLDGYRPPALDTSEHEDCRLVHQPGEEISFDATALSTRSSRQ